MSSDAAAAARIPDAIEPIVAYRAWRYDVMTGLPCLASLTSEETWGNDGWTRAECRLWATEPPGDGTPHHAPVERCTCGFYALKALDQPLLLMVAMNRRRFRSKGQGCIVGKVQLAGKVIEHDEGYRAELARVLEFMPFRGQETVAEVLALTYGTRVSTELAGLDPPEPFVLALPPPAPTAQTRPEPRLSPGRLRQALLGCAVLLWVLSPIEGIYAWAFGQPILGAVVGFAWVWVPPLHLLARWVLRAIRKRSAALHPRPAGTSPG